MIKRQLERRKKEASFVFLIMLGFYLLIVMVVLVIGSYFKNNLSIFLAGTIFVMVGGVSLWAFMDSVHFFREFNIAVSMGKTRRRFVWSYELVSVLEIVAMAVLVRGLAAVEERIYRWLLPDVELFTEIKLIFPWGKLVGVILGIVAVQMLLQALLLRYGWKIYGAICLLGILITHTPSLIAKDSMIAKKGSLFLEWIFQSAEKFGGNFWVVFGLTVSGVFAGIAWCFLRRQQVVI